MRNLLPSLLILLISTLAGQDYLWPVENGQAISSNFGEFRDDHFHLGLDIKTNGTAGKPVLAVADGYVVRIRADFEGYGKALYLALPGNRTAVYGHLESFSPALEDVLRTRQQSLGTYQVSIDFKPRDFPVKRGDRLGLSGNRGFSYAPHLHLELRDSSGAALNPQKYGLLLPDRITPVAESLVAAPLGPGVRVNGSLLPVTLPLARDISGVFHLPDTIACNGPIGLSLKLHDRIQGAHNRYNIYSIEVRVDGTRQFQSRYERLNPQSGRSLPQVEDYRLRRLKRENYQRLYRFPEHPENQVQDPQPSGILDLSPGLHSLQILLQDNAGNTSLVQGAVLNLPPVEMRVTTHNPDPETLTFEITPSGTALPIRTVSGFTFTPYGFADQPLQILRRESTGTSLRITVPRSQLQNRIVHFQGKNLLGAGALPVHWAAPGLEIADPLTVPVNLDISHQENGLFLQVQTERYLQVLPEILLNGENLYRRIQLERVQPNVFLSGLVAPSKFTNVSGLTILFPGTPERRLERSFPSAVTAPLTSVTVRSPDRHCTVQTLPYSFYDSTVVWVEQVAEHAPAGKEEFMSAVYQLQPFSLPLRDSIRVGIHYTERLRRTDRLGLYFYDAQKGWTWQPSRRLEEHHTLVATLKSLEAVAVIRDTIPPTLKSTFPAHNGRYDYRDVRILRAVVDDNLSGIPAREQNLFMMLDEKLLLFAYQPILKEISYTLDVPLEVGPHELIVSATDRAGNSTTSKINFTVN